MRTWHEQAFTLLFSMKICSKCNISKPLSEFHKVKVGEIPRQRWCKDCKKVRQAERERERYANDPEFKRRKLESNKKVKLKAKYELTIDDYYEMYSKRAGKCDICNQYFETLCVDHCHNTKKIRGLLCHPCNTALGFLTDDIVKLQRAELYLS